jgi:predicted O-methyltransferase YrrM
MNKKEMDDLKKPCASDGMKVLFLSVNFEGWVAPTVYYEQQAILKQLPDSVIYGPGFDYETNLVPEIVRKYFGNDRPDVIFCYVDERRLTGMPLPDAVCQKYGLTGPMRVFPTGLDKIKDIPKIAWINDFWHCGRQDWDRILLGNGFDYAFSTYCPPFVRREVFDSFFSRQVQERVRFIPWPRSINPEIFRDDGLERIHDVTLLGAVNPVFYPLRTKMHQVFSQQPGLQYFHQQHPGYQYFSDNQVLTGQRYAQCLQQSKLFASCTGKYHIPFIKLYEALASGAGLLCDIPQGGEYLGLKPFENYLPVTMDNFLETARSYLLDAPMLQDIAQNGRSLFEQKHTVDIRADEFVSILNAIVDGRSPGHWAELSPVSHESVTVSIATPTDKTRDLMKPTQSYHITEIARVTNPSVYAIWYQYGSNQRPHENPPVVTAFPELVMLRGVLLRQLAEQLGAKTFAEVGTARGFQSFMWARYLVEKGIDDGRIFTCDITPHDQRYYKTPMSRNLIFTRRELWNGTPESSRVCFIDGDSSVMAQAIDRPVDMVYIDGMHDEPSVRSDFENLKRFLHPHSVIVFDDCDERFVGIQKAVLDICSEMGAGFQAVEFTPSAYKIAIVQVEATHLDRIRTQDAGHGPNSLTRQKISIEQPRI